MPSPPTNLERIDTSDLNEVRAWMAILVCTEVELRIAVHRVGAEVVDVRAYLKSSAT